jgi:hypothetical protein
MIHASLALCTHKRTELWVKNTVLKKKKLSGLEMSVELAKIFPYMVRSI